MTRRPSSRASRLISGDTAILRVGARTYLAVARAPRGIVTPGGKALVGLEALAAASSWAQAVRALLPVDDAGIAYGRPRTICGWDVVAVAIERRRGRPRKLPDAVVAQLRRALARAREAGQGDDAVLARYEASCKVSLATLKNAAYEGGDYYGHVTDPAPLPPPEPLEGPEPRVQVTAQLTPATAAVVSAWQAAAGLSLSAAVEAALSPQSVARYARFARRKRT